MISTTITLCTGRSFLSKRKKNIFSLCQLQITFIYTSIPFKALATFSLHLFCSISERLSPIFGSGYGGNVRALYAVHFFLCTYLKLCQCPSFKDHNFAKTPVSTFAFH